MKMKTFWAKHKWQLLGTGLGFLGGFLYWYFVGCNSGSCPIQSNWHTSTLYGGVIGFLLGDLIKQPKKETNDGNGTV